MHPWYDPVNDGSLYLALARSLLAGEGYSYLGEPHVIRPPGFSLLLAPVLAAFGLEFRILNAYVSLWGAAAVVLLFLVTRPRLGDGLALLVSLSLWLNPGFQRLCNQSMSDVPGLALLLGGLLLARRARTGGWRSEAALGLWIGASAYVRSAVALLAPAVAAARLVAQARRGRPESGWPRFGLRRLLPPLAAVVLLLAPWLVRNQLAAPPAPADQHRLYDYATAMWHRDPGDPGSPRLGVGEILARAPVRAGQIAEALGSRLGVLERGPQDGAGPLSPEHALVALALVAGALVSLLRRGEPAELFTVASLALLLFYFGFNGRLLLPIYALALPATLEGLRDALASLAGGPAARAICAGLLGCLIWVDFRPHEGWQEIRREHERLAAVVEALRDELSPQERLGTAHGFHYTVLLDRPVYSLVPAMRRGGTRAGWAAIERYSLDAVFLTREGRHERLLFDQLSARYGPGRALAGATLWRIAATDAAAPRAVPPAGPFPTPLPEPPHSR